MLTYWWCFIQKETTVNIKINVYQIALWNSWSIIYLSFWNSINSWFDTMILLLIKTLNNHLTIYLKLSHSDPALIISICVTRLTIFGGYPEYSLSAINPDYPIAHKSQCWSQSHNSRASSLLRLMGFMKLSKTNTGNPG